MNSLHPYNKEKFVFAPGCALLLYKPELAGKVHKQLKSMFGEMDMLLTCCQHDPLLPVNTKIINVCPGCDKRFSNDYRNISTISLWELLADSKDFQFPDYRGIRMSIIDACPTREETDIQTAIRSLLERMNIKLVEPVNTGKNGTCCGDSFYGLIPLAEVRQQMIKRSSEMPEDNVVVYCISCVKAVFNGGKKPKYLVDLLFSEETIPGVLDPDQWHKELREYIDKH
jgi:Fe-S oxidoreductase